MLSDRQKHKTIVDLKFRSLNEVLEFPYTSAEPGLEGRWVYLLNKLNHCLNKGKEFKYILFKIIILFSSTTLKNLFL